MGCSCSSPIGPIRDEHNIWFQLDDYRSVEFGMKLCSSRGSHFLKNRNDGIDPSKMGLRDGDKLLGINHHLCDCYNHGSVLEMMNELFYPRVSYPVTLNILRHFEDTCRTRANVEINVKMLVVDGGLSVSEASQTSSELPFTYTEKVQVVESTINIGHTVVIKTGNNGCYVYRDDTNKLAIRTASNDVTDTRYEFIYKVHHVQKGKKIFFLAFFKSKESNYYINAENETTLNLTKNDKQPDFTTDDSRLFVVIKSSEGKSTFESVHHTGYYWSANVEDTCNTKTFGLAEQNDTKAKFKVIPKDKM